MSDFNPCFLGFQPCSHHATSVRKAISILVFLDFNEACMRRGEMDKMQFQSLFSWISTFARRPENTWKKKISILVFLDFNIRHYSTQDGGRGEFQSLFSWISTSLDIRHRIYRNIISILVFLDFNKDFCLFAWMEDKRISILVFLDFNQLHPSHFNLV